jgi:hypothetical protein
MPLSFRCEAHNVDEYSHIEYPHPDNMGVENRKMSDQTALPTPGFIAIYKWKVAPEHERTFRERWHTTTLRGRELGAFGSWLTRDEFGHFVAIALWPSAAARAAAFTKIGAGSPWVGCERIEETRLQVEDDLWIASPFRRPS